MAILNHPNENCPKKCVLDIKLCHKTPDWNNLLRPISPIRPIWIITHPTCRPRASKMNYGQSTEINMQFTSHPHPTHSDHRGAEQHVHDLHTHWGKLLEQRWCLRTHHSGQRLLGHSGLRIRGSRLCGLFDGPECYDCHWLQPAHTERVDFRRSLLSARQDAAGGEDTAEAVPAA